MKPELQTPDKERQLITFIGWLIFVIIKAIKNRKKKD